MLYITIHALASVPRASWSVEGGLLKAGSENISNNCHACMQFKWLNCLQKYSNATLPVNACVLTCCISFLSGGPYYHKLVLQLLFCTLHQPLVTGHCPLGRVPALEAGHEQLRCCADGSQP
jgi:hypothetical protein